MALLPLLEVLIRRLYPKLNVLEIGLPCAKQVLLARFNPADASGVLMKSLLKLQTLAEDVPAQLQQILVDLEAGKFRVNVRSEELERIATNVRALSFTVFLGLLVSGLAVAGFLVFARELAGWGGLPFLAGVALALAGGLFGLAFAAYLLGKPRRKISLRRFLSSAGRDGGG
jgi:ubiquinone biosynthesis protein